MKKGRHATAPVLVEYLPARCSAPRASVSTTDVAAFAAVLRLAKLHPRAELPAAPTPECWEALRVALEREPTAEERRAYTHRWNNHMTCAWAGWKL